MTEPAWKWNASALGGGAGERFAEIGSTFAWGSAGVAVAGVAVAGALCSAFFQARDVSIATRARYVLGFLLSVDFVLFWLVPIGAQGALFKLVLLPLVQPVFQRLDESATLRQFAQRFVYRNPRHADYFATQALFLVNFGAHLSLALYWQVRHGELPWWLIAVYNFGWVGVGGRGMAAAYTMAHKEGHNTMMYKGWIRNVFGNVFENWIGLWYGGLPYNFSTTHISIHHRLDGGIGDTLYAWDLQRCSWTDFTVYVSRGLLHMSGFGPLRQFLQSKRKVDARHLGQLTRGLVWYWVLFPLVLLSAVPSLSFYFWIVLQPLICMSFFITILNAGFHAFIDANDRVACIESAALLGSLDDSFGEDDHMAHHARPQLHHRDLSDHQKAQRAEWARHRASVFQGADAFSFALLVLFKAWPVLAERYVDFSGKMDRAEIEAMLEQRAKRLEVAHSETLPPLQDADATDRPQVARRTFVPVDKDEGSFVYRAFMSKSAALQLALAREVASSFPPLREW